ncbi:hypothetical protein ACLOJK_002086 [Asimina triloba]
MYQTGLDVSEEDPIIGHGYCVVGLGPFLLWPDYRNSAGNDENMLLQGQRTAKALTIQAAQGSEAAMEEDDAGGRKGGELGFPYWVPVLRRFQPHDPFFISGNIERELQAKQLHWISSEKTEELELIIDIRFVFDRSRLEELHLIAP